MLKLRARATWLVALLLAAPLVAMAHDGEPGRADDRLVDRYTRFAGSEDNAEALINGLRNDRPVTLTKGERSVTFTPATDRMGYGNVDISLRLARAALAEQGIHRPTPEQLKAALNGGYVTARSGERVQLPGVLQQRASGMGWGNIAKTYDVKLGELMRHKHHAHHKHHDKHAHHKHHEHPHHRHDWKQDHKRADFRHDRGEFHRAHFERPERPHKIERPERPERPERHHRR